MITRSVADSLVQFLQEDLLFHSQAIFRCNNGNTYGRFFGGSVLSQFANSFSPLYFVVRQLREVMSTEQPCDLAYEFGDGLLDLPQYPQGFPTPGRNLSLDS
ncbi:hypothetical protein JRO89_XS09G0064400 [Xanthoceras sorbifolium]|uniref:Uncharacterized protein n=1 Tax=Xanthoceras sorbifolium TaxID=99658 RepID=A0ABQ8HKP5_9ROSI|nr:hypothetical protein JRO89_XS09G0064400 [Xanthoceras sorbifolium]